MSRILYFDCFSGASGDMMLGALLDAGLPLDDLRRALGSLAIDGVSVSAKRVVRAGVAATKFVVQEGRATPDSRPSTRSASSGSMVSNVEPSTSSGRPERAEGRLPTPGDSHHQDHGHHHEPHHQKATGAAVAHAHAHRTLAEINEVIDRSALSASGKARAKELFHRLGEGEAAIHDVPLDRIHLHEVGALDSIIDIVGAVFGFEWFAADRIVSSPLNVGGGMVRSAHGLFPVPAPATVRLLQGAPVYSSGVQSEMVTPTGALLVSSYASSYGAVPPMTVERVGYGAGDRDLPDTPNVLRILVGNAGEEPGIERIVVIECEIDDMNPQLFGPLMDRLYAAGALEVYFAPVQMKKNRPGTLLTILGKPDQRQALSTIVFRETTTIGVRFQEMLRQRLDRETVAVNTPLGPIRFKVARLEGSVANAAPEFEDCLRLSTERGLPVKEVQAIAMKAYLEQAR